MAINSVFAAIKDDMKLVEQVLAQSVLSDNPTFTQINRYILEAGGKRMRPALLILCARLGRPDEDAMAAAAASVEMVHMASLIHDDIVDGTAMRHSQPTAHTTWGSRAVVASADYIFAKSFVVLGAHDQDGRLVKLLAKAVKDLSEGEILQQMAVTRQDMDRDAYLARITKKTASLFETSCKMGAVIGGLGSKQEESLAGYGQRVGIAFQILDDILDIIGDERATGKSVGTDIRDGVPTLPIIEGAREDRRIGDIFNRKDKEPEDIYEALKLVRKSGGITAAKQAGSGFVERGIDSLAIFDGGPWVSQLRSLAGFVMERYH